MPGEVGRMNFRTLPTTLSLVTTSEQTNSESRPSCTGSRMLQTWRTEGVVYLRTMYQDTSTSVSLVCSKTKVAPLSPPGTTPRLELCGAQVLSKLLVTVMKAIDIPLQDTYAWSDSTIVLCWLNMPPERLSTYVGNRVGDTLARIPSSHWRHVPTSSNPADLASRRVSPRELVES